MHGAPRLLPRDWRLLLFAEFLSEGIADKPGRRAAGLWSSHKKRSRMSRFYKDVAVLQLFAVAVTPVVAKAFFNQPLVCAARERRRISITYQYQ